MRKYHRWLSVLFGVFLLWIAATGVASQVADLIAKGGFEAKESGGKMAQSAVIPAAQAHEDMAAPHMVAATNAAAPAEDGPQPAAFVCPADMTCRAKTPPQGAQAWVGYLHHLHSGEEFGPLGTVISILSGLALLFFSFSGLWMYIRMWSHRRDKDHKPAWFWK